MEQGWDHQGAPPPTTSPRPSFFCRLLAIVWPSRAQPGQVLAIDLASTAGSWSNPPGPSFNCTPRSWKPLRPDQLSAIDLASVGNWESPPGSSYSCSTRSWDLPRFPLPSSPSPVPSQASDSPVRTWVDDLVGQEALQQVCTDLIISQPIPYLPRCSKLCPLWL